MCNKITIKYLYKICNNKVHHADVGGEAGGQEKEDRRRRWRREEEAAPVFFFNYLEIKKK